MINVIAQYCLENRLTLNPKEGKTEVVEFMCEPSRYTYTVPPPPMRSGGRGAPTHLHVKQGYQYLGFWLDAGLTFDEQATRVANKLIGGSARVVAMGGRPGGLPIRSRFQLWSALALTHLHGSAALLSEDQIQMLQRRMDTSVQQMVGSLVEPAAVLADLGIPDASTIKLIRTANLRVRLQTLPEKLLPAAFHRHLETSHPRSGGLVSQMQATFRTLHLVPDWRLLPRPPPSLARPADGHNDRIVKTRNAMENKIRKAAWEHHRQLLLANTVPHNSPKMKEYVCIANQDLRRARLDECAAFLRMDLTPKQEAALVNMRAGGSLLATNIYYNKNEADTRCDGCTLRGRNRGLSDEEMVEGLDHALFRCCKPMHGDERNCWLNRMSKTLSHAALRAQKKGGNRQTSTLEWVALPRSLQLSLALGSAPPEDWSLNRSGNKKALHTLHEELVANTAPYIAAVDMGLRRYCRAWLKSVDEEDTTEWRAVHDLWEEQPALDSSDEGDEDDASDV